jgi:uncharacterized protein (DUF433 family)
MQQWKMPDGEPPPVRLDTDGAVRVAGSRVTLDTLIGTFNAGSPPDEIQRKFPSLELADIYAVLAYYLRNREEIDQLLAEHERQAAEIRRKIEEICPPDGFRERLLARQTPKP